MFGSLRSLWIFVDPTSDKPNINEDDFTYDDAENEIIMLTNTEETIPAGMRHNKKKRKGKICHKYFCRFLKRNVVFKLHHKINRYFELYPTRLARFELISSKRFLLRLN